MKFKNTAIVTALSFIATIALTACGHDPMMDDEIEIPEPVSTREIVTEPTEEVTEEETTEPAPTEPNRTMLGSGGDTFTVLSWNPYDASYLLADWLGMDVNNVKDGADMKTKSGTKVKFICLSVGGSDAYEYYDKLFNEGEDIDVYLCEPDWALKLLNNDSRSAPIEALGISEDELSEMYPYTLEQGRDNKGVLKALTWGASPGCFAYNAELAEKYLNVKTPEEMQVKVADWEKFKETAKTVSEVSKGKTALADSVDGMWTAYTGKLTSPLINDNKLNISNEIKQFADLAKDLWDCGGVSKNGQWTDDWMYAGQKECCMGYFIPSWGFDNYGFGMTVTEGNTLGKWALCEGPSPYSWGGTMLAVNTATDNGNEALDFIYYSTIDVSGLIDSAYQASYVPNCLDVTSFLIEDEFIYDDEITKHFINGQDYMSILDRNAKALDYTGIITEYDADIKFAIVDSISQKYLKDGNSWEETCEYIEDKVEALMLPDLKTR